MASLEEGKYGLMGGEYAEEQRGQSSWDYWNGISSTETPPGCKLERTVEKLDRMERRRRLERLAPELVGR